MNPWMARAIGPALIFFLGPAAGFAWDYEGHRLVNQLALAAQPTNFPAFVQTPEARERIGEKLAARPRQRGLRANAGLDIKLCPGGIRSLLRLRLHALRHEAARQCPRPHPAAGHHVPQFQLRLQQIPLEFPAHLWLCESDDQWQQT